ncbi:MAG: LysR family transcriptional regulator [Rhodospirillaceae bacterium]|jgi:DNA-binding transcriptional LysR family regulator|nr:LysR family transcriptional regulator [Rhodospirillaceae bacterium]MBT7956847.1 LysR family transcriptional regulator [Rhodospirillaceae bacterium]
MQHLTRQLLHLVAVIDHGSLSRAADALNLTQPALSRSIRFLETEFDGRLLDRGREGAKATKLGEVLYIHGKNILASLDRAAADVQAWHQHDSGHMIIGSTSLPAVHCVPDAIASFLAERPKVGLRFEVRPMTELMAMLRQGSLDLFVGALAIERPPEGVETTILLDERMAVLAGPQHPLTKKRKLKYSDLAEYPWLLTPKDTELRQQVDAAFMDIGLTNVEIAVETVATAALMPLLEHGNYLTIHSNYLLAPDIKAGKLVLLMDNVAGTRRSLAAFHRPAIEMTPLIGSFIDHLKNFVALNYGKKSD